VVTVETLLRQADAAMYRAKAAGRGRCVVFGDAAPLVARTRQQIVEELTEAVQREELSLHYQPIVDTGSGALAGVEALCRWERDGQVVLAPSEFIPIAEETGMIDQLGEWVLVEACRQAAEWRRTIGPARPFYVSVNVSAKQLTRPHFAGWVASVLATAGLDPGSLVLELTESGLVEDVGLAKRILREVRALGIRVAIDDFGAGYSSLGYLRSFSVDIVKIDRSFMQGLGHSAVAAAVVGTVMQLASALRLTVVAEGVETAGQSRALSTVGCHVVQGYLYSRPRTAAEIGTTVAIGPCRPGTASGGRSEPRSRPVGIVAGGQLGSTVAPLRLHVDHRVGDHAQRPDRLPLGPEQVRRQLAAHGAVHEGHEPVGKPGHGAPDADAAHAGAAAETSHPAPLRDVAVHHRSRGR
jgi:EAL domain-containing protein (putative c-di-GMP-specific phosphodiesterase class I)